MKQNALDTLVDLTRRAPEQVAVASSRLRGNDVLMADPEQQKQMVPVEPDRAFARMCRAVEREVEHFKGTPAGDRWVHVQGALTRAALIRFDRADYEAALLEVKAADRADLYLPPMMPFDDVVLYDQHGCVFMFEAQDFDVGERYAYRDEVDPALGGGERIQEPLLRSVSVLAFGCDGPSTFSEAVPGSKDSSGSWWLGIGRCGITAPCKDGHGRGMTWSGIAMALSFAFEQDPSIRTVVSMESTEKVAALYNALRSDFYHAVGTALDELYYIDLPRHHLVVETPCNHRRRDNPAKIPRAHDRPRVRVIDPGKVSAVYPDTRSEDGTASRRQSSHPRRGFTKHLTSEKWKAKRWQRIRVRPTWVGPEEWAFGKFQYKVVVRKNDDRVVPATETA